MTKPLPPGWPRIATAIYYDDARAAIDWLCKAFGFELRLLVEGEGGSVEHSELTFGPPGSEGVVMVSAPSTPKLAKFPWMRAPSTTAGGNTQSLMVYVDDLDAHFERAKAAGATIDQPIATHDYGDEYWTDRSYGCSDIGGHHWWFNERMRNPKTT